jgi:hypothetical protein
MVDGDAGIGAVETAELFLQLSFVTHQDDADAKFLRRLNGAFDRRGGSVVTAHRINGDFHVVSREL